MDPILRRALDARRRERVGAFVGEHCCLGPTLVVPLRVVWRSYELYCDAGGFHADASPTALREVLDSVPWARVTHSGTGRMRTVVHGLGLRATAPVLAPRM